MALSTSGVLPSGSSVTATCAEDMKVLIGVNTIRCVLGQWAPNRFGYCVDIGDPLEQCCVQQRLWSSDREVPCRRLRHCECERISWNSRQRRIYLEHPEQPNLQKWCSSARQQW
ncbi:hypothetical protein OSTOST_10194 [Ostertagia ostertagi]